MKQAVFVIAFVLLGLVLPAQASFVQSFTTGFQNGGVIPDGSLTGWSDTRTLSGIQGGSITDVSVSLNLSGGWNGDLYVYLVHSSGFTVLLNRVGRSSASGAGYGASGMNVVLNDAGSGGDIHWASVPTDGGNYVPDGRNIDPRASKATFSAATPTALLSSFDGLNPNGTWTLFIADVSGGDQSTLRGWGLDIENIETAAVAEPGSAVEGGIAVLFLGGVVSLYRLKGAKAHLRPC